MSDHTEANANEHAARLTKAYRLADWLNAQGLGGPDYLEALPTMNDEWWQAVARHAQTRAPSPTTRQLVLDILKQRAEEIGNPFEGLPGYVPAPKAEDVQFKGCDV